MQAANERTFREDLYYRLNVFPFVLPPLRDRADDIPLLICFLVAKLSIRLGKQVDGVSEDSKRLLRFYRWPGNIRELENVIERATVLSAGPIIEIDPEILPGLATTAEFSIGRTSDFSLELVERQYILSVLKQTDWAIEVAARCEACWQNSVSSDLNSSEKISVVANAISK